MFHCGLISTELERSVLQYVEKRREGMIDYLRRLVSVDTQTLPELNYDCLCEIKADRFSGLGCETSIHETHGLSCGRERSGPS